MKSVLIFVPKSLHTEVSGYMFGQIVYDQQTKATKFFIIGIQHNVDNASKPNDDLIGYFSGHNNIPLTLDQRSPNWVNLSVSPIQSLHPVGCEYHINDVTLNNCRITHSAYHTVLTIYDQLSLLQTELLVSKTTSGDHFRELKDILHKKSMKTDPEKKLSLCSIMKTFLLYAVLFLSHPVRHLCKITNKMQPILDYSTLGLHLNGWLENLKWMLGTIGRRRRLTLKTGNYITAMILDVLLGILLLKFLLRYVGDVPPSEILLDNAEHVVDSLKDLVNWLMGAPAGLKLNHSFNGMLGRFFLYHINLWWTFLQVTKPVLEFAFNVLLLLGKLGITFQIAIAADLLALVSFHSYCIYVYAARLFNMQLQGLTALFHLFLGKKKNPLRQRVDSCQYQADQLFVGTLLFTILTFLMPTTWVYYTVFTTLRLILIALGGLLTRLRFYIQIMPVYAFTKWLFRSPVTSSSINMEMYATKVEGPTTLVVSTVVAPWSATWKRCIPETINPPPPVEWAKIVNNVFWGQLLYPL